ncbi:MAG: hypothetical protein AB1635_14880 [Acidobacteriota bacterium]
MPATPQPECLDDLSRRVAALEARVRALEAAAPSPGAEEPAEAAAESTAYAAVARVDTVEVLTAVGRALIVLGGAYLLRAITDSRTVSTTLGVSMGLAYALAWMASAARGAVRQQASRPLADAAVASMVAFPLVVEATVRFRLFSPEAAAIVLTVLSVVGLGLAIRVDYRPLAWLVMLGGQAAAIVLMIAARTVLPFAVYLVLFGVATVWLGYVQAWKILRWPAGLVAALAVTGLTVRALGPAGLEPAGPVLAVQALFIAAYLGSFAVRTLVRGRELILFEAFQTVWVLLAGLGGAVAVVRATDTGTLLIGSLVAVVGVGAYAVAFAQLTPGAERLRTFYFYSTLGLVFTLVGTSLLLSGTPRALAWTAAGFFLAWAWQRSQRPTIGVHVVVSVTGAAITSGLVGYAARGILGGEAAEALPGWPALLVLGVCLWAGGVGATDRMRAVAGSTVPSLLVALLTAAVVVGASTGLLRLAVETAAGTTLPAGGAAALATIVLSAAVVVMAWLAARARFAILGWLVYPVLALAGLHVLVEDLRVGSPASLVFSFAAYGTALVIVPRLRRQVR